MYHFQTNTKRKKQKQKWTGLVRPSVSVDATHRNAACLFMSVCLFAWLSCLSIDRSSALGGEGRSVTWGRGEEGGKCSTGVRASISKPTWPLKKKKKKRQTRS